MAESNQPGRQEIEAAWAEYQRRGVGEHDWPGWAAMFTADAHNHEHNNGYYKSRQQIRELIN
jgi:hypothetical protein